MESLAKFQRLHPPTFTGEGSDPMVVESRVDSMEKLFLNLRVPEQDWVMLAVSFLDKMAHHWWKAELKRRADAVLPTPSWEEFREPPFATYFPDCAKQQMEEDFKSLRQENRTI